MALENDIRPLVLHVIHHLAMGGLENGVVNLINRMSPHGYRHAIACVENFSDFRDRLTRSDVEVYALRRSEVGVHRLRCALYRLCRQLRPSIVHTRNMSGLDALLPARIAGVRCCVHGEHGWDVGDLSGQRFKPVLLRRLHSPLVDHYITVSKDLERYLIKRVGVRAARITQIYNGVDTALFAPGKCKPADVLPASFVGEDKVVIGTVGRIQPVKDQASLVRAFAALIRSDADAAMRARLAIVGDGPLLGALRELVCALGIDAHVWLPGACTNVPDMLRSFDVFVLPSLSEGISNTILESMASGLPVIATATGGNVELVEEGVSGCFMRPGDVAGLTMLLAQYVRDRDMRRKQGERARRIALERYGLDTMVSRYQSVYDEIIASKGSVVRSRRESDATRAGGNGSSTPGPAEREPER